MVRAERSNQAVTTFELFNPDGDTTKAKLNTTDVLPAATLTLRPLENVNIRVDTERPPTDRTFEMSEAPFNDVIGGRLTFGNPELERATIDHIDLRRVVPESGRGGVGQRVHQEPLHRSRPSSSHPRSNRS